MSASPHPDLQLVPAEGRAEPRLPRWLSPQLLALLAWHALGVVINVAVAVTSIAELREQQAREFVELMSLREAVTDLRVQQAITATEVAAALKNRSPGTYDGVHR